MTDRYRRTYKAFISYAHRDNRTPGRKWADWLHHALETWHVPEELIGKPNQHGADIPAQIYPVFQDEKELSASANLSLALQNALDRSEYLIYLASPHAARSPYVQEEIRHFKRSGKSKNILALILSGDPADAEAPCFPDVLRHSVDEHGNILYDQPEEVLAADVRYHGEEGYTSMEALRRHLHAQHLNHAHIRTKVREYSERVNLAKLKIIAALLDVPLAELTRRDETYQLERIRRKNRLTQRIAIAIGLLAVLAIVSGFYAWRQKSIAQSHLAQSLYSTAIHTLAQNDPADAAAWLTAAMENGSTTAAGLAQSLLARREERMLLPNISAGNAAFSPDGTQLAAFADSGDGTYALQLWNTRTRTLQESPAIRSTSPHPPLFDRSNRLYLNTGNSVLRYHDGHTQTLHSSDHPIVLHSVSPDGAWLALRRYPDGELQLLSLPHAHLAYSLAIPPLEAGGITFSADSGQAVSWANDSGSTHSRGHILTLESDAITRTQAYQSDILPYRIRISADGRHLLLDDKRSLRLISADGKNIPLQAPPGIHDWVGFNPDGHTLLIVRNDGYSALRRDNGALLENTALPLQTLAANLGDDTQYSPDRSQRLDTRNTQTFLHNIIPDMLLGGERLLSPDAHHIRISADGRFLVHLQSDARRIDRIRLDSPGYDRAFITLPEDAANLLLLDNDILASLSHNKNIRFHRLADGAPVGKTLASDARTLLFNHDHSQVLARTGANSFAIWNIADGREILRYRHPGELSRFMTDTHFRYLLIANDTHWQLRELDSNALLLQGEDSASHAAFSANGRYLALAKANGETDVYRLDNRHKHFSLPSIATPQLLFSPDGSILLASHDNRRLRLYRTADGKPYGHMLAILPDSILLRFSADSRKIYAQNSSGSGLQSAVHIYDSASGNPLSLPLVPGRHEQIHLSADERRLITLNRTDDGAKPRYLAQSFQIPADDSIARADIAADLATFYNRCYDAQTGAIHPCDHPRPYRTRYFADPYIRPLAPGAHDTVMDAIARLLPADTPESLQLLAGSWYYHPLARAGLAEYFQRNPHTQALAAHLAALARAQLLHIADPTVRDNTRARLHDIPEMEIGN